MGGDDLIRIWIASDPRMRKAEVALEWSIRKRTQHPLEIHWLRAGDPGFGEEWQRGRPMGQPYTRGWATDFTAFRFAVPEDACFQGRAIYLDVDMLVLGDIAELWELPTDKAWSCAPGGHTDVSVIDCETIGAIAEWPSIKQMRPTGNGIAHYVALLRKHKLFGEGVPATWDCLDGKGYDPMETRLIHFTDMTRQPWKPWPERFKYPTVYELPHIERLFWEHYEEGTKHL